MTKVVLVEAYFSAIGKNEEYSVPTGRTKKTLFIIIPLAFGYKLEMSVNQKRDYQNNYDGSESTGHRSS